MVKGIIYRATNKITGQFYIGQSTRKPSYRKWFHIHRRRDNDSPFHKAIDEYGPDAFEWEVLHMVYRETYEELGAELDRLEKLEIQPYFNTKMCYNESSGGWDGFEVGDATKKKISDGVKASMTDKKRETLSRQMRERRRGMNPRAMPIVRYSVEDGRVLGEYASVQEAADKTRVPRRRITECAEGRIKTAGGWKWRYKEKE